jgi:electron transfer flavoprotein beta subunit
MSRGLDECCWINAEEAANADGAVTGRALASAIKKIGGVSLVICAEGASDTFARQTAPRIGALLDWPVITSVRKIEVSGNAVTALRKLDDCLQTVKVELPAVAAVLPEINEAPIPTLKAVLAAARKPVTEYKAGDLGIDFEPKVKNTGMRGYAMQRKNIMLQGTAAEKVKELITALKKEGVF